MSLSQRLRALPPAAQVGLALAALLLLSGLLSLAWFSTRPRFDVLFQDLRPADAATIVARLDERKAPYKLAQGGATILAPRDQIDALRLDIAASDLPLKGAVGFELFNKSDMGLTEFAQRINYQRALQGELARTIMTVSGVESARVHLTLPEPSVFRNDRRPPRASVTLTTRPSMKLDAGAVAGVQRLVAASVADLDVADVAVLDQSGHVLNQAAEEGGSINPELQQTRAIEQYYAGAARAVLSSDWPDSGVEVVVPLQQWGSGATGDEARDLSLRTWSPGERDFEIRVSVSLPEPADAALRDTVRARLVQAGLLGPDDGLLFPLPAPAHSGNAAAPSLAQTAEAVPAAALSPARFDWRWLAAPLLVGALLLLLWRMRPPRALTAAQKAAWAQKLSRLAEGGEHGL